MKTSLFDKEKRKKLGEFKIPFTAFPIIYGAVLLLLILLWIFRGFELAYPVLIGIATLCFSITLTLLIIYRNKLKKTLEAISDIIQNGEISDLQEILFEEYKSQLIFTYKKKLAFLVLFETEPIKTMNQICAKIEEEITNGIYSPIYLEYLKKYKSDEDKKLIYEYLFDAILKLQRIYFTEYVKHGPSGDYSSTYLIRKGAGTMNTLSHIFNFKSIDHFIKANVINTFKIFFKDFTIGEAVDLERIAKLSRTTEIVAEKVLLDLLELYPELGTYREFEMQFIPNKEIVHFEAIVDFESLIYPLE